MRYRLYFGHDGSLCGKKISRAFYSAQLDTSIIGCNAQYNAEKKAKDKLDLMTLEKRRGFRQA